jgi:hypothetical protein
VLWIGAAAVLVAAGGLAYRIGSGPAAPAAAPAAPVAATSAPAAVRDFSGKWVTEPLTNPYDRNQTSILRFEFEQSGDTLFGTVSEKADIGGSIKGIQGGQVTGDAIVFHTQGMTTTGTAEQPYNENYRGTFKDGEIEFVRQNDVASGGLPQKFTAKRE